MASEKMEEITTITKDMNQMDKNWKWSTKVEDRLNLPFPESVIEMHWGYLGYLEEPQDYFKVIYDQSSKNSKEQEAEQSASFCGGIRI